jgi:conjugative relaxase-like TrwC/TraI family protein
MSADASRPKIGEGRDGRGSHLAPPEPEAGCGCTVQTPVQVSVSQNACTTITVIGARGGAGTSTIAAVLALTGRTMVRTELVAHEPDISAALLGAALPDELPAEIVPDLTLTTQPEGGSAELCIVDAGTLTETTDRPSGPGERRVGVVRGPGYLALRTLLADDYGLDGIVLLTEPGRALTRRDVTDVTGIEIVATVPVTPAVARSIDAGLLAGRLDRMSEFRHLRRWLTGLLDHFRRVLAGQDAHTGEYLISAMGSAGRAGQRRSGPGVVDLGVESTVDTARAAASLGVSTRYVRMLMDAGQRYRERLAEAGPDTVVDEPRRYLLGERQTVDGIPGRGGWRIPRAEIERLAGERSPRKPRPGYDVTLRPPKSVSVLWALADEPTRMAFREAHTEAVDEVVRYLESRAIRGRVTVDKHQREVETDGLIAAAFDHRTSRAGDPLLHTHVVVANMTRVDTDEGPVWRAIAGYGLFEHAKAAGHLYQAHLRHALSLRLGVKWGSVTNGYADIEGVPEAVIETFSKRRTEIEEVLAESGNTSARSAQIATLQTRKPKDYSVEADTLFEHWRSEADNLGFSTRDAQACMHRSSPQTPADPEIDAVFSELAGPQGLTQRASTFRRSEVIEALASRFGAACTARQVEVLADDFLGSDACVVVDVAAPRTAQDQAGSAPATAPRPVKTGRSTQTMYTSAGLAAVEEELLSWAADRNVGHSPSLINGVVDAVLAERKELSAEQASMVRSVCAHRESVLPIAGRPGAGKTYAAEAIVAAHVAAGVTIVGCAVSATAAAELEHAAGFVRSTAAATTVAKLLIDLDSWGGLAPGAVVVVDEASMLATRDLHRLVAHARHASGSVVLVGDPDQHGPVEVGGAFLRLCRDQGDSLVRLVENNRQSEHVDRLAIDEYRDGHVSDALARLDNEGRVVRSATAGESFDAMVADWYADHLQGNADPMIAGPNSTRRALNERARALLKANGELTGDPVVVAGREFLIGDQVVARRNDRRLRGGSGFIKNGSTGVITELDTKTGEATVAFDREGDIRVPRLYLVAGHLEHGYARTTYGVQGATHNTARYHPTDLSGFEEGYVAITRGRASNRLYIVDGTITPADDEAHQAPESQRFDLDDIAHALTRRRAGAMAADSAGRLTTVHQLATTHTLAQLRNARLPLERLLAEAPPDASAVIDSATTELDGLHARRNLWTAADRKSSRIQVVSRAIGRVERKLAAAQSQQARRQSWLGDHADVVDRHELFCRAERHRRSRITGNPQRHLPEEILDQVGPEPRNQRERREWMKKLTEQALAHDLTSESPAASPEAIGPEPF